MKPYLISRLTDQILRGAENPSPGSPAPSAASLTSSGVKDGEQGAKIMFLPRIRCNDCPGKVYTTMPGTVVQDFEVHLKNRNHRARVEERKGGA